MEGRELFIHDREDLNMKKVMTRSKNLLISFLLTIINSYRMFIHSGI